MNKYYYIAYRKPRGRSKHYVGDGIIEANSVSEVKKQVSYAYDTSKSNVKVTLR